MFSDTSKTKDVGHILPSWSIHGLHHLMQWFCLVCGVCFFFLTAASLWNGHVNLNFPLVSDIIGLPPESNIFAAMVGTVSVVACLLAVINFMIIDAWNVDREEKIDRMNHEAFKCLLKSAAGLLLLSALAYPLSPMIHGACVCVCIWFAARYAAIQVKITYRFCPKYFSLFTYRLRASLLVAMRVTFLATSTAACIGGFQSGFRMADESLRTKVPGDPGFVFNTAAGALQYTMFLSILLFFATYFPLLTKITLHGAIEYHEDESSEKMYCEKTFLSKLS